MSTEKVKVFEEQAKKGLPIWAWLLPLLLLLALAVWFFTRNRAETTTTTAAPVTDQTKPDNGVGKTATAVAGVWTAGTIADEIRSKGRVSFNDNDVHFATDSAKLAGDSQAVLDATAQALQTNGDWKMRLIGHTDSTGTTAGNEQLATDRATSVMTYLTAHGIDKGRLSLEEKGQHQPVATNATDAGRAENRRVELIKQ